MTIMVTSGIYQHIGTFNIGANTNGQELGITWTSGTGELLAGRTYSAAITFPDEFNLSFYAAVAGSYEVKDAMAAYWTNPILNNEGGPAINLYTTSVPEPSTMILAGSALAAVLIGAFLKRFQKCRGPGLAGAGL